MMKILALDFDGVIVDSQFEGLFTSFHAYLKINPSTEIFGGKEFCCCEFNDIKEKYKDVVKRYMELRPFIKSASDYFLILYIIENKLIVKEQKEFDKLNYQLNVKLKEFIKQFYETRKEFQEKDLDGWCKLSLPYSGVVDAYKKIKDFKIVFVTNNNALTVIRALKGFGIVVEQGDIIDKEFGIDKKDNMKIISEKYKVKFSDIHFIDDQVDSLIRAKKIGVKCYLALWGYNNKEQMVLAKKEKIILLSQDDFSKVFT